MPWKDERAGRNEPARENRVSMVLDVPIIVKDRTTRGARTTITRVLAWGPETNSVNMDFMSERHEPAVAGTDAAPRSGETVTIDNLMARALEIPGLLSLAAGFTDNGFLPCREVRAIVDEILSTSEGSEALQYGIPQGRARLRELICGQLRTSDAELSSDPGELDPRHAIITNGSQQALYMSVQALCRPGDVVLVESPTYFVFLDLLKGLGVDAVAMPARDDRLADRELPRFFAELKASGQWSRIRAVYLVSYFSNPSGLSLDRRQKAALLEAMEHEGLHVPILEDIAYREMYFDEPWPVPTLLARETDAVPVLVTGTFTKSFSTGLKVGYAILRNDRVREKVLTIKRGQDFGTSNFAQAVVERALDEGTCDKFLGPMRKHYAHKCQILHDTLEAAGLRDLGWTWEHSRGGLYLWLTAPAHISTAGDGEFFEVCLEEKVMYVPGELCYSVGGSDKARLSFGYLEEDSLALAAERFVRAARRLA